MINGLDLFSGIGGLSIALSEWVKPVAYCEIDRYCQGVLLNHISNGSLANAPIWDEIKTLSYDGRNWPEIDIIYGGFPCQDISVAGLGKGLEGERSGLFFEIMRLAKEIKPKFIFLENVPAITSRGGLRVVREIAEMGYDCRWCIISAASIGALHRRERWFLLANAKHYGSFASKDGRCFEQIIAQRDKQELPEGFRETERTDIIPSNVADTAGKGTNRYSKRKEEAYSLFGNSGEDMPSNVADTRCECQRGEKKPEWPSLHFTGCCRIWKTEPEMGRLVDGLPLRVDKLRALGNAVVPQQAKEAFKILMGLK